MEVTKQVVSLELARKLKELGVRQESEFYWITDSDGKEINVAWHKELPIFAKTGTLKGICAFTVAELGEILPDAVATYRYSVPGDEDPYSWACIKYVEGDHSKYENVVHAETEADARAKMLIYLLENELITL